MASSPQRASQNAELPWTTFRLARFSYAANEGLHDSHIKWTHHPERDNLVLVLDFSRVRISDSQWEDSKMLKVISGAEILVCTDREQSVQP